VWKKSASKRIKKNTEETNPLKITLFVFHGRQTNGNVNFINSRIMDCMPSWFPIYFFGLPGLTTGRWGMSRPIIQTYVIKITNHSYVLAHTCSLKRAHSYVLTHTCSLKRAHSYVLTHTCSIIRARSYVLAHTCSLIRAHSYVTFLCRKLILKVM